MTGCRAPIAPLRAIHRLSQCPALSFRSAQNWAFAQTFPSPTSGRYRFGCLTSSGLAPCRTAQRAFPTRPLACTLGKRAPKQLVSLAQAPSANSRCNPRMSAACRTSLHHEQLLLCRHTALHLPRLQVKALSEAQCGRDHSWARRAPQGRRDPVHVYTDQRNHAVSGAVWTQPEVQGGALEGQRPR